MNKLNGLRVISQVTRFMKKFRHDILMEYELFLGLRFFCVITGIRNIIYVHVSQGEIFSVRTIWRYGRKSLKHKIKRAGDPSIL